jgi:hypothetical protein
MAAEKVLVLNATGKVGRNVCRALNEAGVVAGSRRTDPVGPIPVRIEQGRVLGVETSRGFIGARKVGVAVAGSSSQVMAKAGMRLPMESHVLQAFVSEGLKPLIDGVMTFGAGHFYVSQSDKGELVIGAGTDAYTSYTQRGALHVNMHTLEAICELFPMFRRMRVLRNWGGIVDVTPDRSPIIGKTPVTGMYINCGWGTGGFKAIPAGGDLLASTSAHDKPHPLVQRRCLGLRHQLPGGCLQARPDPTRKVGFTGVLARQQILPEPIPIEEFTLVEKRIGIPVGQLTPLIQRAGDGKHADRDGAPGGKQLLPIPIGDLQQNRPGMEEPSGQEIDPVGQKT